MILAPCGSLWQHERWHAATTMTDLHARLESVLHERLAVARNADLSDARPDPGWYSIDDLTKAPTDGGSGLFVEDARHIALHDPADAIARYEAGLRVLERHVPSPANRRSTGAVADLGHVRTAMALPRDPRPRRVAEGGGGR